MIKKQRKKNNMRLVVGILLYRASLVYAFFRFVIMRYQDDYFVDINVLSFVISYSLFLVSVFAAVRMVKCRAQYMSGQLFLFTYLFAYVPSSVLCSYMWDDNHYTLVASLFWILTMFVLSIKGCRVKNKELKTFNSLSENNRKGLLYLFVVAAIVFVLLIIYSFNHFNFSFSFSKLYDVRAEMKATQSTLQGLVFFCMATVINPILIGIFCKKRKYFFLLLSCILQILLFMVGGDKFYILLLGIGIIAVIFYKKKYIYSIPLFFSIVIGLSTLFIVLTEGTFFEEWLFDIGVRRILFTPAFLNYYYFDYSQFNPNILFTDHQFLSRVLVKVLNMDLPYESLPIADKIGLYYWNETGKSNGGFGSAFAQIGYLCIIVYPILYLAIGNIFDKITLNLDEKIYMPLVASLTIFFLDYSIAGIELTHILFSFILFGLSYSFLIRDNKHSNRGHIRKKCTQYQIKLKS